MVIAGVGEFAGIEENVFDAGDESVEEFGSFRVVEQRSTDGRDLHETRQRQRGKRRLGETVVQVEEKLYRVTGDEMLVG